MVLTMVGRMVNKKVALKVERLVDRKDTKLGYLLVVLLDKQKVGMKEYMMGLQKVVVLELKKVVMLVNVMVDLMVDLTVHQLVLALEHRHFHYHRRRCHSLLPKF